MKIKRFEASSMSEALRQIKKEFGEEAVILSAKTIRKNSLLGRKKADLVVVTAAIDRTPVLAPSKDIEVIMNQHVTETEGDQKPTTARSGGMDILRRFNPITLTGQKKVKPKIVQLMSDKQGAQEERHLYELLISQGINEEIAAEMDIKAANILPADNRTAQDYQTALARLLETIGIVGLPAKNNHTRPRTVVMLGPSGAGKTSAAAKLAAKRTIHFQESVALVSLDNQRVAGSAELERYARILKIPLKLVGDADELDAAMKELAASDLVIVDTPGMAADDYILCERIGRILTALDDPELHLLIGADLQEKSMARILDCYKSFKFDRLVFTRLDWAANIGPMINQAAACHLPIAYVSDSTAVPEGLMVATGQDLAARIVPDDRPVGMQDDEQPVTVIQSGHANRRGAYYVANRNSDIFHLNECKSVKRINTANMIVFKDPAEAMGRQFKPCRMCCSELIFPKPIDRLARGYAAGNRY